MTSEQNSEARFAFFGCVYRNAQTSPAEIGRMHCRNVIDLKALTTDVVTLMESAFTVAMAESKDLRIRLDALEAEKYALEDQVKGLQELMAEQVGEVLAQADGVLTFMRSDGWDADKCACCDGAHVFCRYFKGLPDFSDLSQASRFRNDLEGRTFRVVVQLLPVTDGKARDV